MKLKEFEIIVYSTPEGKEPFQKWLKSLKDTKAQRIILLRIQRIRLGLFGDCKTIVGGNGLQELRIPYGPGFRVYFAKVGDRLILLIGGGDKSSQARDIEICKGYLADYKEKNV